MKKFVGRIEVVWGFFLLLLFVLTFFFSQKNEFFSLFYFFPLLFFFLQFYSFKMLGLGLGFFFVVVKGQPEFAFVRDRRFYLVLNVELSFLLCFFRKTPLCLITQMPLNAG